MPVEFVEAIEEESKKAGIPASEWVRRALRGDLDESLDLEKHPSLKNRVFGDEQRTKGTA